MNRKREADKKHTGGAGGEAVFYIVATGPPSRPRRLLKHNDSFAVIDSHGDIGVSAGGNDGFFHNDTRYLSHLALTLGDAQPLLLGSDVRDDNLNLFVDLTNPDIIEDGTVVLQKDTAYIARTIFVRDGALRERLAIVNHGQSAISMEMRFTFNGDFADVFEVRGVRRKQRGILNRRIIEPDAVELEYLGLDSIRRAMTISFEPAPDTLDAYSARYHLTLQPKETTILFVRASSCHDDRPRYSFTSDLAGARREFKAVVHDIATVETSNKVVNEILQRAVCDLYMLTTATPQGAYPYAGIPWYSTTFGRDGLIAAIQMLWFDPRIAYGVLNRLAHLQAKSLSPSTEAQPGKILHEMRSGEMAICKEVPFDQYYGSVDSTPLFIILAGLYAQRTGDMALISSLWPAIEAALSWMDDWGDEDGDGFIEYAGYAAEGKGLTNQGWKDSSDSVFHADGSLATGPIALVEVQGYAYMAKQLAAYCADRLGLTNRATELRKQAALLSQRFESSFWCEDLKTYAIALDGRKRPCRVRTSNAGHAMFTGIMRSDRAKLVASDLLRPHFLTGWGIRTVAQGESRYNPMSYHNGSVWPHDNAMIASGFERYGIKRNFDPIFAGIMDAAHYMDHRRLPELFCGFRRRPGRGPTLYPVACSPQAWAAGAPFQFIQASLGLRFDPNFSTISLHDPVVPSFIDTITIRNLRLGPARADFSVQRQNNGSISLQVLKIVGDLKLVMSFDNKEKNA